MDLWDNYQQAPDTAQLPGDPSEAPSAARAPAAQAPDARAAQIARIQQLERIRALEAQKGVVQPADTAPTPSNAMNDGTMDNVISAGKTALRTTGKALDYPRGTTTGPLIAQALDAIPGGSPVYDPDEAQATRSFKQTYPTPLELLRRKVGAANMPQDPTVSQVASLTPAPIKLAASFLPKSWQDAQVPVTKAADIAATASTDPATYLSGGLSNVAKGAEASPGVLGKLMRALGLADSSGLTTPGKVAAFPLIPADVLLGGASKANYAKAFEPTDRMGEQAGNPLKVSDILRQKGFVGNMDQATQAIQDVNNQAGAKIGGLISKAGADGATVPSLTAFQPAIEEASRLRSLGDADAAAIAQKIDDKVQDLWTTHGEQLPIEKAQELKKFYDDRVYRTGGVGEAAVSPGAVANEQIAQTALQPGVEAAMPDALKPEFLKQKGIYSSTDPEIIKKMTQESNKVKELRGMFQPSDVSAMLAGSALGGATGAMLHGATPLEGAGAGALGALILKQLKQAYQSTTARTLRGAIQQGVGPGTGGVLDEGLRQGTVNGANAWGLLNQKDDNGKN